MKPAPYVLLCALLSSSAAVAQSSPNDVIAGDETAQKLIGLSLDAFRARSKPAELGKMLEHLHALRLHLKDKDEQIVRQVVYAAANGKMTRLEMIVLRKYLHIPHGAIVEAAGPLIGRGGRFERAIGWCFMIDGFEHFREFAGFLERHKDDPPLGLIEWMMQHDAGQALQVLARVYKDDEETYRRLIWAEHQVADVLWKLEKGFLASEQVIAGHRKDLEFLGQHKAWWARRYAAGIMHYEPALQTEELVERLQSDSHESVRQAALRIVRPR